MYASTLSRRHAAFQLRWYLANDVVNYLYELKDFILNNHGKLSSTYLPSLEPISSSKLFGPDDRFPENMYLICEGIGDWNSRLQRMKLLVSIITNGHRLQRQYYDLTSLGGTEVALLKSIDDALRAFEAADDLVDRAEFENRYKLVWESNDSDQ